MSISSLKNDAPFQDKEVQTVVKVFPFVLLPSVPRAAVTADKKFGTVLSLEASQDCAKFYSLLQYCPYHDIEENSIRSINLPRKTKLQWLRQDKFSEDTLRTLSLADDDGVAELCNDLLLRMRSGKKSTFADADTQTDIMVLKTSGLFFGKRSLLLGLMPAQFVTQQHFIGLYFREIIIRLISSKDDIGLLTESSINTSATNTKANTYRSTEVTDRFDTVHYLSPASSIARTEYEGDLDYQQFYSGPLYPQHTNLKGTIVSTSTSSTSLSCETNTLQRTLAIIKPDALCYKDVVLRAINQAGLKIVNERTIHLTPEQVSEIYEKYYGTPAFPHMVVTVSVSPVLVLSLQAINAVERWRAMVGSMGTLREEWFFPYSVRTRFGLLGDFPNTLHASEGFNEARKENRYIFPRHIQEPLPADGDKIKDYITTFVRATLLEGLAEIVRKKPIDPVLGLAEWLLLHNPYKPIFADPIALTPT